MMRSSSCFVAVLCTALVFGCSTSEEDDDDDMVGTGGGGTSATGGRVGSGGRATIPIPTGGTQAASVTGGTAGAADTISATDGGEGGSKPSASSGLAGASIVGSSGAGGAAGASSDDGPHDHEAILLCEAPSCPYSYAQMDDDQNIAISQAESTCVLSALRDRTPGVFVHAVTSNSARGVESTEHVYLVYGDGTVAHTAKRSQEGGMFSDNGTAGVFYTAAERCELADASYFGECLASLDSDDLTFESLAWSCLYIEAGTDWLVGCEAAVASCQ